VKAFHLSQGQNEIGRFDHHATKDRLRLLITLGHLESLPVFLRLGMNNLPPAKVQVSVITPTKNRLRLLSETMGSGQGQNFEGWEHLIVDDESDGTAEEVARRSAADPRIHYVQRTRLALDGMFVLQVPVRGEATFEDATVTSESERLEKFLQEDHVRVYGLDLKKRVEESGFACKVLSTESLPLAEQTLDSLRTLHYREVFVCRKPA
jgi:hypothetical protein